mmetsp:Transcript_5448/g.15141  ORF Transcript_5448/g.15141 Transcript_5448/m.15141 type:complete len:308 (-) Transcript_5448:55-978(-)
MAERLRLSLPTGQRHTHRLAWADADAPESSASRSGRLDWSVVVLDELTVDLEVSVELRPSEPDAPPGLVLLQEVTRGRNFSGSFEPAADARLAAPEGSGAEDGVEGSAESRVEAVIFEFSNAFSWWTDKDIELIALRERPSGPPLAKVPPLLPLEPLDPPPRRSPMPDGALAAQAAPELRGGHAESEPEEAKQRFAAHVDACLAAAEESCPSGEGGEWLQELLVRIAALRGLCQRGPAPAVQAAAGDPEAAAEAAGDERPPGASLAEGVGAADPAAAAGGQQLEREVAAAEGQAEAAEGGLSVEAEQ